MTKGKQRVRSKNGEYQESVVLTMLVKKLKKLTGIKYSKTEIKKVWKDYVEQCLVPDLIAGKPVRLSKRSRLEIVGERVLQGTRSYNLMSKGLYVTRNGVLKKADNMNKRRLGVKYGVKLFSDYDKTVYFKAHHKISKKVHTALNETMINYRIIK